MHDIDTTIRDQNRRTALEALDDRPGCDADFRVKFEALITRLDQPDKTDSDSNESFDSAVEEQE